MNDVVQAAVVSFHTTKNPKENLAVVETYIKLAKSRGAEWVFLPELWTHRSVDQNEFLASSKYVSDTMLASVCELAKTYSISIFAGTWTETSNHPTKFYNTQYVIDSQGTCIAKYQKVHLFSILPNDQNGYSETKRYVPGDKVTTFSHQDWNIGLSTCFDLRFPSFYEKLCECKPLDVITVPSGFLERTGKYHWEPLLKARAIENQCYIIASNKIGKHEDPRIDKFYGHSMIIDPWGEIVLNSLEETGVFFATISKSKLEEVRRQLPLREVKSCKTQIY